MTATVYCPMCFRPFETELPLDEPVLCPECEQERARDHEECYWQEYEQ